MTSPPIQIAKWMILSGLHWRITDEIKMAWETKSTIFLLWKLMGYDYEKVGIAAEILSERKERLAMPILLLHLHSPFWINRQMAIHELGEMGDPRAITPLMRIVKKGASNENYINALYALSKLKYEPALPIVIDLLKNEHKLAALEMLGYFGKAETLPLLRNIAENDVDKYVREDALEALETIKNQWNLTKPNEKQ